GRIADKLSIHDSIIQRHLHFMGYDLPLPDRYISEEDLSRARRIAGMSYAALGALLDRNTGVKDEALQKIREAVRQIRDAGEPVTPQGVWRRTDCNRDTVRRHLPTIL